MNVYICQRYKDERDSWAGALIVVAHSEDEAVELYMRGDWEEKPYVVRQIDGVYATGAPRIIYNDMMR